MKKRKAKTVALVTPPYHCGVVEAAGTWLPLAFVYLAGSLRAGGRDVVIYDAMSRFDEWPQIERALEDIGPDVVATSAITATYPDAVELLRLAKRLNPQVVTLLGNVHPSFLWADVLREHGDVVDFVIRGEGEVTCAELLEALEAGSSLSRVEGIAYLRDGEPFATPQRPFVHDLDLLPAAWDLVDWEIYSYRPKPGSTLAVVSSSRGCTQACTFCSQQRFWARSWRARSPESFVSELEHLHRLHGVDVAMLSDETPTMDEGRWREILRLLAERGLELELLMETRVDDILRDEALMGLYREAGVVHIYVGVESVRQDHLDLFQKDIRVEDSRRAIDLINGADMVSETSFVLGMPDDTISSIRDSVELAIHYGPDMAFFLAIAPWPYADIYEELRPHIEVFDYRRYNLVEPVVRPSAMTLEELSAELDRAHRLFFTDRISRLDSMSTYKRRFMVSVMELLVHHSYLGEKMRAMAEEAHSMPPEMEAIFRQLRSTTAP